jgi:hypothetical protein
MNVAGKLPATAGWQPALPRTRRVRYPEIPPIIRELGERIIYGYPSSTEKCPS